MANHRFSFFVEKNRKAEILKRRKQARNKKRGSGTVSKRRSTSLEVMPLENRSSAKRKVAVRYERKYPLFLLPPPSFASFIHNTNSCQRTSP